jgi:tight adherence protein C
VLSGVLVVGMGLASPLLAVAAVALHVAWPRWRRARQRRIRRDAIQRALPDAIDLVVLAVGAGLTPLLAVERLAPAVPAPVDEAFALVVTRVRRGQGFADALDALPETLGAAARPLAAALAATWRYGVPLGPALELIAVEARRERRRHAEEMARRLPVRLCFPLVACILPAFVLLAIAPLVAGALRSLRI